MINAELALKATPLRLVHGHGELHVVYVAATMQQPSCHGWSWPISNLTLCLESYPTNHNTET